MKGMELPISTVVIVAIVVLVLVVVSAFFLSQSGSQFKQIDLNSAFSQMCSRVECSYEQYQELKGGSSNFYETCAALYGKTTEYQCLKACGCTDESLRQGVSAPAAQEDLNNLKNHPALARGKLE